MNVNTINIAKARWPADTPVWRQENTNVNYFHDEDALGGMVVTETASGDTQLHPHVVASEVQKNGHGR